MTKTWAIYIDINKYYNLAPLWYAVRDAVVVRDFFLPEVEFERHDYLIPIDVDPGNMDGTALKISDTAVSSRNSRADNADNIVLLLDACRREGKCLAMGFGSKEQEDVQVLKIEAYGAETRNDWDFAQKLWTRVLETPGADRDRALPLEESRSIESAIFHLRERCQRLRRVVNK